MQVLITGGAGFIGSHLADAFIDCGHTTYVFDNMSRKHEFRSHLIEGDLLNPKEVNDAVRGKDLIIHAAGILGTHETVAMVPQTVNANILGSVYVLEALKRHGGRLLMISKPNVWLNPYSITKDCVENFCFMYVREFGCDIAVVKLFNVYGPRQKYFGVQKAIPSWIVNPWLGKPIEIFGEGKSTMDLVYTDDVTKGVLGIAKNFDACKLALTKSVADDSWGNFRAFNEQVLELGSGVEISVSTSVEILRDILYEVCGTPAWVTNLPMRRGEVDGTRLKANISRLSELTGFRPAMPLEEGLRRTIRYYRREFAAGKFSKAAA